MNPKYSTLDWERAKTGVFQCVGGGKDFSNFGKRLQKFSKTGLAKLLKSIVNQLIHHPLLRDLSLRSSHLDVVQTWDNRFLQWNDMLTASQGLLEQGFN